METTDSRYRFRLALSLLEQVRGLIAESERALAAGTIDRERYDSVVEYYAGHLQRAKDNHNAAREAERRKLTSLEHELRATLNRHRPTQNVVRDDFKKTKKSRSKQRAVKQQPEQSAP